MRRFELRACALWKCLGVGGETGWDVHPDALDGTVGFVLFCDDVFVGVDSNVVMPQ